MATEGRDDCGAASRPFRERISERKWKSPRRLLRPFLRTMRGGQTRRLSSASGEDSVGSALFLHVEGS